jgi:hypothetical protein
MTWNPTNTLNNAKSMTTAINATVTETVTNATGTINATVAKTSTIVASSVDQAVDTVRNVQLDLTRFDAAALAKFDPRKLAGSLPVVEMPDFELPKIDVPVDLDRVVDMARDVAYAGIGAAVIAAQQADATVRRFTSRTA